MFVRKVAPTRSHAVEIMRRSQHPQKNPNMHNTSCSQCRRRSSVRRVVIPPPPIFAPAQPRCKHMYSAEFSPSSPCFISFPFRALAPSGFHETQNNGLSFRSVPFYHTSAPIARAAEMAPAGRRRGPLPVAAESGAMVTWSGFSPLDQTSAS